MKLRTVSRIHFVAAISRARCDDPGRRRSGFHRSDLHGRSVGAQESPVWKIKCVLFIACGMIGRSVERIEAMPFAFDVGPIRERESHSAENRDRPVEHLGEGMQRSALGRRPR